MESKNLQRLKQQAAMVHQVLPPTPQLLWPLLAVRAGCELWLKHENFNPTGSFKVRGGLIYLANLSQSQRKTGVIAATRGNFGQSVAYAGSRLGINCVVVVPVGNCPDKNRAMKALGAEVIIEGVDFDESVAVAKSIATQRNLHLMPSFHLDLVDGVASYALELLEAVPDLEQVYVPIGLGSGICGMVRARDALNLKTEIIGVVTENANAYQLSFDARKLVATNSANTLADGLAVRSPNSQALDIILAGVSHVVTVSEQEVLNAIRYLFEDTHTVAEGAGAAATAAALKEADKGAKVAAILTGGNINKELFSQALNHH